MIPNPSKSQIQRECRNCDKTHVRKMRNHPFQMHQGDSDCVSRMFVDQEGIRCFSGACPLRNKCNKTHLAHSANTSLVCIVLHVLACLQYVQFPDVTSNIENATLLALALPPGPGAQKNNRCKHMLFAFICFLPTQMGPAVLGRLALIMACTMACIYRRETLILKRKFKQPLNPRPCSGPPLAARRRARPGRDLLAP